MALLYSTFFLKFLALTSLFIGTLLNLVFRLNLLVITRSKSSSVAGKFYAAILNNNCASQFIKFLNQFIIIPFAGVRSGGGGGGGHGNDDWLLADIRRQSYRLPFTNFKILNHNSITP